MRKKISNCLPGNGNILVALWEPDMETDLKRERVGVGIQLKGRALASHAGGLGFDLQQGEGEGGMEGRLASLEGIQE